jgi:hypothetical protein
MSRVTRTTGVRHAVFGLALAGLAMSSIDTADAGDLEGPVYGPYPRYNAVPPGYRGAEVGDAVCRIVHERRIDVYGREIIHRIRICDEGPVYPSPYRTMVPPEYGYPPRPYYEPSRSRYYSYPRPPAPIEGYYN